MSVVSKMNLQIVSKQKAAAATNDEQQHIGL